MSEDLTNKQSSSDSEKLTLILTTVQALKVRVEESESQARPAWQKILTDISQLQEGQLQLQEGQSRLQEGQSRLQEGQSRLEEGQSRLQEDLNSLRVEVRADILQLHEGQRSLSVEVRALRRDVDNRFDGLYSQIARIETHNSDLHDRVTRLELDANPPNCQT